MHANRLSRTALVRILTHSISSDKRLIELLSTLRYSRVLIGGLVGLSPIMVPLSADQPKCLPASDLGLLCVLA